MLNYPPPISTSSDSNKSIAGLKQPGRMFLKFQKGSDAGSSFERPCLLWTDGPDASYTVELFDIHSIRNPTLFELDDYTFAIPSRSFVVSTGDMFLMFEATDASQTTRVMTALQKIISRLAMKILMGDDGWMVQMMLSSSPAGRGSMAGGHYLENADPHSMTNVTNLLVEKTTAVPMKQTRERRSRMRLSSTYHAAHAV